MGNIDTDRSMYCAHGDRNTKYVRMVRVYWTEGTDYTKVPRDQPLMVSFFLIEILSQL